MRLRPGAAGRLGWGTDTGCRASSRLRSRPVEPVRLAPAKGCLMLSTTPQVTAPPAAQPDRSRPAPILHSAFPGRAAAHTRPATARIPRVLAIAGSDPSGGAG